MKILATLFISLLFLSSCKSDDDSSSTPPQDFGAHFPITANSYWTYNNTDSQGSATRDSLYIASSSASGSDTTLNLDINADAGGFMTSLIANGTLRVSGNKLLLNGQFTAPIEGFPDVSIPLTDLVLYDMSTGASGELSANSGQLEEIVEQIPLVIDYVISTNHVSVNSQTDSQSGAEILLPKTNLVVNLAITAEIEFGGVILPVPILVAQDVFVATNEYEQYVGLINSDVSINYQLEDLGGIFDLPIPSEGSETASQDIDTYVIIE